MLALPFTDKSILLLEAASRKLELEGGLVMLMSSSAPLGRLVACSWSIRVVGGGRRRYALTAGAEAAPKRRKAERRLENVMLCLLERERVEFAACCVILNTRGAYLANVAIAFYDREGGSHFLILPPSSSRARPSAVP